MTEAKNNSRLDIRYATPRDSEAVAAILNHYITNTPYSMTYTEVSRHNARYWVHGHSGDYPMFVAEIGGEVVGWCSLSQYRNGEGYRHTAEDSIYIKEGWTNKGIGTVLMKAMAAAARDLGFKTIIAFITGTNQPSIALHEKAGFVKTGCLRKAAVKFGQYYDIDIMQLFL